MTKKYICIADYQGGEFAVGEVATIEGWREIILEWCSSDAYDDDLITELAALQGVSVIARIADWWDLEIVEFDEHNKEHRKLAEKRGN